VRARVRAAGVPPRGAPSRRQPRRARYLRAGWPLFIEEDPRAVGRLPRFLGNALRAPWRWPLQSHDAALRRLFPTSPRLRALASFDDLYVGLHPREAPAVFSLLGAIELGGGGGGRRDAGVYYPRGGFAGVVDRLAAACAAAGVDVRTACEVDEVLVADGAAAGVRCADGSVVNADYVVVNADLAAAEPRLLRNAPGAARSTYDDARFSTSSITFLWAFSTRLGALRHHNVFLAEDAADADDPFRAAWDAQLPARGAASPFPDTGFHFYACAPSRTDDAAAPPGGDTVMVLVPTPPLRGGEPVDAWVADARDAVFARLAAAAGLADARAHLVHERVIDPRAWRDDLGLRRGSVFGLAHGLDQLALFRPARASGRVANLAFVGASTRPGNGVPLVLTGARLASDAARAALGL